MASTPSGGASETSVQNFIHAIEQGRYAGLMRKILLAVGVLAVALAYLGWNFTGFSTPEAMDQAQIAREISRGNGFSTKLIRPLAIWQIEQSGATLPHGNFPDTFNAPLPPLVNALAVKVAGETKYGAGVYTSASERMIVVLSMIFFLLAVGVNYFTLRRLFDARLAGFASLLTLVTDLFWKYTLSGLPHMLMLLLFSAAVYALTRALETHALASDSDERATEQRRTFSVSGWLAGAGVFLGLVFLCHAVAGWLTLGAVAFGLVHFRRRGPVALVMLATFVLVITPWMVRTYRVSGSPFGLAGYAIFDGLGPSTSTRMRSPSGPMVEGIAPLNFRVKIEHGIVQRFQDVGQSMGGNFVALLFFVSLLHPFRRPETAALRWAVLWMWLFSVFGMAMIGVNPDSGVGPTHLEVLLCPIMIGFGLAMALVLFGRLEANERSILRLFFSGALVVICALPMAATLLPEHIAPHNFPPYFEPAISALGNWTTTEEIIGSDMPWAVAYYADRKSLWIPNKLHDFLGMSDQGKLDGALAGIFLSPISRGVSFISGIYKGEYQEYGPLIFGNVNLPYFPFKEVVLPSGDLNYSFYSDTKRWERKKPAQ